MKAAKFFRYAPIAWLALGLVPGLSEAQSAMKQADRLISAPTPHAVSVTHMTLDVSVPFEPFTQHFEALLGRFDPSATKLIASDPAAAEARLAQMEGDQGLMIFMIQNHGALLALAGLKGHAKRYHVGNPRIALQMTQHDIRAGLYAPLSVLVYETAPGRIRVEYDQPSTLFGQFGNRDVGVIGKALDDKLARVIEHAAQLAASP
ncbi:protein of unknown function DUF302 [Cupriavidus sp. YR651]|uniref:DUF302 domain-containing protein n=1 Tax=Cupriavidus sp. YR651 TaxID=1855315 RepID=UPI00088CCD80|nr:DUF302 domain-containing protein [Cupriavidus sp. YR651]SDC83015.1 protein of unknown function DUF302 [Cupriavidus sp. YR651]